MATPHWWCDVHDIETPEACPYCLKAKIVSELRLRGYLEAAGIAEEIRPE